MRDETQVWLDYADENLQSARLLCENQLYNPCLQNLQQSVEKILKAALLEEKSGFPKTHSIGDLRQRLSVTGFDLELGDEEVELLDSIYLPSKYPLGSVLPDFEPDRATCVKCLEIAERVFTSVRERISVDEDK